MAKKKPTEQEPVSTTPAPVERHEEYHVTVDGIDPIAWHAFCSDQGVKPLYIELSTRNLQLMCALKSLPAEGASDAPTFSDFTDAIAASFPEVRIVREKFEVNVMNQDERPVYYECHVKIDGPMLFNFPMASRDLYRQARWYVSKRSRNPFDADAFYRQILKRFEGRANQKIVGYEYEVCVRDTNHALDAGWEQ